MSTTSSSETNIAMMELMGRKHRDKFGSKMNEAAGSSVSSFAQKQLEKVDSTSD